MIHPLVMAAIANSGLGQTPVLTGITDPLTSVVVGAGGDRPQSAIRFNSDGTIDEATGDTGAAFVFSNVGTWLDAAPFDSSDWEINFTVDSEDTGDPGTWTGDTRGSYIALSSNRTYTWSKDGSDLGTANSVVTVTVRQVSNTSNSDSQASIDYDATISL